MEVDPIFETRIIPPHLNNTYIRPSSPDMPELIKYNIPPFNNTREYKDDVNQIQFNINSSNLLDPYSLFFDFDVTNPNTNAIQLDHSAHSIISSIAFYSNGQEIEVIKDYDFIHSLIFDMQVGQKQRSRRKFFEGFGDNRYGTNETVIPGLNNTTSKSTMTSRLMAANLINLRSEIDISLMSQADVTDHASTPDMEIPNINNWGWVKNGKLYPVNREMEATKLFPNVKHFRIPLMLKTIGFGQQLNNYKLVPLEIFGQMSIVITLNPDAFFVPFEIDEFSVLKNNMDMDPMYSSNINRAITEQHSNKYIVTCPLIMTEQYRFDSSIHNKIMQRVREGGWTLDYIDYEILAKDYTKMQICSSYTLSKTRKNIKALYFTFTNDLYRHTKFARKLARYNRGLRSIILKQGGEQYPPSTSTEHNSLNSFGPKNALFFFSELAKAANLAGEEDTVLTLPNFCIDTDASHLVGLRAILNEKFPRVNHDLTFLTRMFDSKWKSFYHKQNLLKNILNSTLDPGLEYLTSETSTKFNNVIDAPTSKCIYALNFETSPQSTALYRTEFSTDINIPIILEIDRVLEYEAEDIWAQFNTIFFIQTILIEKYETVQLTSSGHFTKI
jgi:hypothetical protein